MPNLQAVHKPVDLAEALALLGQPGVVAVPMAGGTWLTPRLGQPYLTPHGDLGQVREVVDLSQLGWGTIERDPDTLRLGPMVTLAAASQDPVCRTIADGILAETARRDAVVNVRNVATVGGTLVVAPIDSEFLLALLALGAELTVHTHPERPRVYSLARFLRNPAGSLDGGLISQVRLHLPLFVAGGLARVARTPSDHPIVAAAATISEDADAVRIALGGVTHRPLVIQTDRADQSVEAVEAAMAGAELYEDFRGSAEYRRQMGALMARRALDQARANCARC